MLRFLFSLEEFSNYDYEFFIQHFAQSQSRWHWNGKEASSVIFTISFQSNTE
jgi:hypothetical protein